MQCTHTQIFLLQLRHRQAHVRIQEEVHQARRGRLHPQAERHQVGGLRKLQQKVLPHGMQVSHSTQAPLLVRNVTRLGKTTLLPPTRAHLIYKQCGCLPYYFPNFAKIWKKSTTCNLTGLACLANETASLNALDPGGETTEDLE